MKHNKPSKGGKLRFLSNIYDPNLADAKECRCYSHNSILGGPEAMEREWQRHLDWINSHIIGEPKATKTHSVEQLKALGKIGIYTNDD
jgi:hypothetical protein